MALYGTDSTWMAYMRWMKWCCLSVFCLYAWWKCVWWLFSKISSVCTFGNFHWLVNIQLQKFLVLRSTTSLVTCGHWEWSCISCKYILQMRRCQWNTVVNFIASLTHLRYKKNESWNIACWQSVAVLISLQEVIIKLLLRVTAVVPSFIA